MLKNGEKVQAKVWSKQPKRTGASRNWLNIEIAGKEPSSVNWDEVLWLREIESGQILMQSAVKENNQEVLDAKERELNSLKENNVFNWVEDQGQDSVSCKCVFTEKQKENGSKMLKARLVAQGFDEKTMNNRTDSPTHSRQVLRIAFVLASIVSWEIHHFSIPARQRY